MVKLPETKVIDESDEDPVTPEVTYDVSSYGSDMDVEGLVRRQSAGEIFIPPFQRDYVWNQVEASRFIESLLLGLPVPGVFFATDPETNKFLVIDGQQRLKSLLFFVTGVFNPKPDDKHVRVFKLLKVQQRFLNCSYKDLEEKDRLRLSNAVIHATIVKQSSPPGDDTSVFHIFERLNSGGRRLTAQEIRVALYHGRLTELVRELNSFPTWRTIFGKPHQRLKDQELILRFMALYVEPKKYARPMGEFLNKFAGKHRNPSTEFLDDLSKVFVGCIKNFGDALGHDSFRPQRSLNAAVFDSMMVGLARRIDEKEAEPKRAALKAAYQKLLKDKEYLESVSRSTADETFLRRRLQLATAAFANI